ncbi:glycoside hydrolase [Delitschia confertaspora ATCC 74209]|uniref:Beta-xylanase n=1 Tax=Delitschia confertaspora ATCC 74209 TaxID=1513339 RepID=A0A9P4MRL4_9PLEO|nr:glycoside hydrolase [Delitschia confertaspora ATCC 74209]
MKVTILTAALAAVPASLAAPTKGHEGKTRGLDDLAKRAGLLYFGTAIDNPFSSPKAVDPKYQEIARNSHEFGQVTPANGQKWMYIEPERNVFNYTYGDAIIKPAKKNGQMRRCHNLLWHSQLPDWLTSKNYTKPELLSIMENHIKHEASYYKNECYAWDVVNEAFNEDGTLREDLWLWTIGPDYMEYAFKFARKYAGHGTKLYYNDYNIERIQNKSTAVVNLVKTFRKKGVPIDGVGLQAHFTTGSTPSYEDQLANINRFNSLGVEVALTELDVRVSLPDSPEKQAQQAKDYAASVKACKDAKNCVGVTVWDFWDPVSWVPGVFAGKGNACLWAEDFTKKPAYYAVADALRN